MSGANAVGVSTHAELMRAMGSKEGFDPIPPSQHAYFLDIDESMTNRAVAWVWSKTISPGRGGKRSPFARDKRGNLTHVDAAADLRWTVSNARVAFDELARQGRIRIDAEGRIWLCGDVPEPRRTKSEDDQDEICTYFPTSRLSEYFQQLPEKQRLQREAEYSELQTFKKRAIAETMARARAAVEAVEESWYVTIGFEPEEQPRGRPKKTHDEPLVALSLVGIPKFVHISDSDFVQKGPDGSVQSKNGSVHNSYPYSSENQSVRVSEEPEPAVSHTPEQPHSPTSKSKTAKDQNEEEDASPVVATVEEIFGRIPKRDPLRKKFAQLPADFNIPALSVCRFLTEKIEEKEAANYPLNSPGALMRFAEKDLVGWIRQRGRDIESDRKQVARPASHPVARAAPDPEAERLREAEWRRDLEQRLQDDTVSEEEKKTIRSWFEVVDA